MRNRFVRSGLGRRGALLLAGAVVAAGLSAYFWFRPGEASGIPVAEVVAGEFLDTVQLRADIKAVKSVAISAPSIAMADLRIVRLARNGGTVKPGDVVVQFDPTSVTRTLEEKRSELKRAEAEIERLRAQLRIAEEQNLTEQTQARYDVERARLDAGAVELLSRVEAEQKRLALDDAEQRLKASDEKVRSGRAGAAADLESAEQKRDKARAEVQEAERNLAALTIKAPIGGMVTLLQNYRASSPFGNAPEFRVGDRAWSGAQIAELPDLTTALAAAHVDEAERGRLQVGQLASVRVDALPDREFAGKITEISALARADFGSWPPVRSFDVAVLLDQGDPRLRPGMTSTVRIVVDRIAGATLVPAGAAFARGGRTVVYVLHGSDFEERPVEVGRRNTERLAVVGGLKPGEQVALKDPHAVPAEAAKK
jgi:HlyD family secretion protein